MLIMQTQHLTMSNTRFDIAGKDTAPTVVYSGSMCRRPFSAHPGLSPREATDKQCYIGELTKTVVPFLLLKVSCYWQLRSVCVIQHFEFPCSATIDTPGVLLPLGAVRRCNLRLAREVFVVVCKPDIL